MDDFTHFNSQGRARMVDISEKVETVRTAIARSSVHVTRETYEKVISNQIKKGDVLGIAQVAGVMAAKQTASIIPMCHPIQISGIDIRFDWVDHGKEFELQLEAEVKTIGGTGVEMEALTAVTVAGLTVYDMCKAVDRSIVIGPSFLLRKSGGKSGDYVRSEDVLLPAIRCQ